MCTYCCQDQPQQTTKAEPELGTAQPQLWLLPISQLENSHFQVLDEQHQIHWNEDIYFRYLFVDMVPRQMPLHN